MKLPYISIEGVGNTPGEKLDSLIKLEPILAWLGYEDEPTWNNCAMVTHSICGITHTVTWQNKFNHLNHGGQFNPKRFLASDITGIIHYVQNYK